MNIKTIIQTILIKTIIQTILWSVVIINQINKNKGKIYNHCTYTHNYYKKFVLFVFTAYKDERKDHKFWQQKNKKRWLLQKKNEKIFNIDDIDVN